LQEYLSAFSDLSWLTQSLEEKKWWQNLEFACYHFVITLAVTRLMKWLTVN